MGISMSHGILPATRPARPVPRPPQHVGLPSPAPRPDAPLLRQARGVSIRQKRTFLQQLARQPWPALARLVLPNGSAMQPSEVMSPTWGSHCLVQGLVPRIIQADAEGHLLTNARGRDDPVKQMVFWEPAPGHPQRALVHAVSIDGQHPADLTEATLGHLVRQGFSEAEVRVGAHQPELAERFHQTPGWQATTVEGGDLLFRRNLGPALPEV